MFGAFAEEAIQGGASAPVRMPFSGKTGANPIDDFHRGASANRSARHQATALVSPKTPSGRGWFVFRFQPRFPAFLSLFFNAGGFADAVSDVV